MKFSRTLLSAAAAIVLSASAISAHAADCSPSVSSNSITPSFSDLVNVTATACAGFYDKNIVSGNPADIATVNGVLTSWGISSITTWLDKVDTTSEPINFNIPMFGDTVVAIHWGNRGGDAGNVSAIYRFDAGAAGITMLDLNNSIAQGLSNAAIYVTTPIPEPETYALMLAGLGVVGFMARRRKQQA
ncbi:MAG: FxDxF family PEP-CTERM protein [Burkholderiaceae bacterium]